MDNLTEYNAHLDLTFGNDFLFESWRSYAMPCIILHHALRDCYLLIQAKAGNARLHIETMSTNYHDHFAEVYASPPPHYARSKHKYRSISPIAHLVTFNTGEKQNRKKKKNKKKTTSTSSSQ